MEFDKYYGKVYNNIIKSKIILSCGYVPQFVVLSENTIVTMDFVPDRVRIFVNNLEENIITFIHRG